MVDVSRERSIFFVSAHEAFLKIAEGCRFDFSVIQRCFEEWMERYSFGRYARLVRIGDSKHYLFLRLFNRFMEDYKEKLKKKLAFLHFVSFKTFLTLTVDPKKFMRLSDEYLFISKAWSKLRQALGRHFRFFYIRILEITKAGRPHLHLLTTMPYFDIRNIRKLWVKYGGGVICKIRRCGDTVNGLSYVLKYVTKTIRLLGSPTSRALHDDAIPISDPSPDEHSSDACLNARDRACSITPASAGAGSFSKAESSKRLYAALLFASNRRLFSFNDVRTRDVILDKSPQSKCDSIKQYDYTGTVTSSLLAAYCREFNIELQDRQEITMLEGQEYDWRVLFGEWID